ncbi:hypothetical protein ACN26Y_15625 [Micromonospora sp. WMMD558]|uniref:hypothetical protein n=1 Tax=unclassified Micromonospora TaxID=2617518 RepID=UPI0012B48259|nr:hypothetical protein [Micromonospora sp. WMMC415]QGN47561.1 hypothetical protein GKC29_12395 [Micromonospora sp. WMMC415]
MRSPLPRPPNSLRMAQGGAAVRVLLGRWRRRDPPVPLGPRHRRTWRGLRRWCSCGLRWTACPDRHATTPTEPPTPPRNTRWRDEPTRANPQVGRVGRLTPAQTWRANGGRW